MTYLGDIAQLIIAIVAAFSAWQAWEARRQSVVNTEKIQEVHLSINSRMDQLLEQKGLASEAVGAEKERNNPRNQP